MMATLWQDLRYGLRVLVRDPGFTLVVVAILAVGVGANTAVFSVVNAVLLRPLPYREPDRLVTLFQKKKDGVEISIRPESFAYWREHNEVFEQIAAFASRRAYLTGLDEPRHIRAEEVSPCIFTLLGAQPLLGRTFLPEEEKLGNHRVVVLSYRFWRDQWGSDPGVIDKTVELDGEQYTIIGVMPPEFQRSIRSPSPFWLPLVLEKSYAVMAIARLKPGVTIEQARAQMVLLAHQLEELDPKWNAGFTVTVHRYLDDLFGDNRRILLLLLGSAGLVLLIACSNVANLLLARAALRRQEIGVRLALGAGRGRIVRQVLTESILLSTAGGLLGLLVTYWGVRALVTLCPADIPRIGQTRVDLTVLAFTLGLSMFTGLLFGLVPAWRATDIHLGQFLKEGQVRAPTGRGWQRLRDGLVVSQIGIALTLLMGAALLMRSLAALHQVDLGFQPHNVLVMHVEIPEVRYPQPQQRTAFFDQLLQNVRALPGVHSAAVVSVRLNLARPGGAQLIAIGSRPASWEEMFEVGGRYVGRDFFETMGIPVLRGRTFIEQDVQAAVTRPRENLIIDEALARRYFPNTDPIGQRIYYSQDLSGVVVGVVGTIRDFEELTPTRGTLYQLVSSWYFYVMDVVIKTEPEPMRLADALRAQVRALDKDQTCELRTLESKLTEMLGPRRFSTVLLGVYAGTALLIACAGLYGLLQYVVAHQAHEIGIRMALGARNSDILRTVLRRGLTLTLTGVAMGLAGTLVLTRLISSLLYGVRATDPATFVGVAVLLTGVALAASSVPAWRAARTVPMNALRYE
jgi:putative ABC transport system permease protein